MFTLNIDELVRDFLGDNSSYSPEKVEEIVSLVEDRLLEVLPDELEYVLQNLDEEEEEEV